MVNEKQGKAYEPVQIWDRKLMRSVIRSQVIKKDGFHKVNKKMSYIFKQLQNNNEEVNA